MALQEERCLLSHADEELMDMDVDQELVHGNKRTFLLGAERVQTSNPPSQPIFGVPPQPVPSASTAIASRPTLVPHRNTHVSPNALPSKRPRKILKANRKFNQPQALPQQPTLQPPTVEQQQPQQVAGQQQYIVVLDTNVILNDLNALKLIVVKAKAASARTNQPNCDTDSTRKTISKIIVPHVVLQELDHIKDNSKRSRTIRTTAQNAIKFIHEQLSIKNGLVQGERSKNPDNRMSEYVLPVENNDDRILDCCVRIAEQSEHSNKSVILLTDDINLQNNAKMWHVDYLSIGNFIKKYLNVSNIVESKLEQNAKQPLVEESKEPSKRFRSNVSDPAKTTASSSASSSTQSATQKLSTPSQAPTTSTVPADSPSKPPVVVDTQLKYELENRLIEFITTQVRKQYLGQDVKAIFPQFNPKNAALADSLALIKKNWMGVFSDCFNRNRVVLETIDALQDRKNADNAELLNKLYARLKQFIASVKR